MKRACVALAAAVLGLAGRAAGVSLTNDYVILTIDADGSSVSMQERATGRQLLANPRPFVRVAFADGTEALPRRMTDLGGGRLRFELKDGRGTADVSVKPQPWGFVFTAEDLAAPGAERFVFVALTPSPNKWVGHMVGARSDETSAAVLRGLDLDVTATPVPQFAASVEVNGPRPWKGLRAALAAGPRAQIRDMLKETTLFAGVPRSEAGGAWSQDAPANRRAYLFAPLTEATVDGWIDLAERSGITILHLTGWWKWLGHYPVDETKFPDGYASLKRTVDRIHAAGLFAGSHTLTASIAFRDPAVTPVASEDLEALYTYTLARPLDPDGDVVWVNEPPGPKHALVATYSSFGNYLRLGGEIVQYKAIDRETKPYSFTGVKRGCLGTKRAPHEAGSRCDYPRCRFLSFFPAADTGLQDEIASAIADAYNKSGLDELYFDGSEGNATSYSKASFQHLLVSKIDQSAHPFQKEASSFEPHTWWYHSRLGALDHPLWGMKAFADANLRGAVGLARHCNFLAPQGGWWCPRLSDGNTRGHFLDDMEFFAGKTAALDVPPSVQGPDPTRTPVLPTHIEDMMTVLGWYERSRLAQAFAPEALALLQPPMSEARLRQDAGGTWRLTPVKTSVHRAGFGPEMSWKASAASAGQAALRVEALYSCATNVAGVVVLSATNAFAVTAAKGVTAAVRTGRADPCGNAMTLTAKNESAERKASWAKASVTYPFPYRNARRAQYGIWVKGDGSGALLNLQLRMGQEYFGAISDHHVRLDFTGWQFVRFLSRERDAAARCENEWPYGRGYEVYRNWFNPHVVAEAAVYLNDIEPGRTATVAVSDIVAYPQAKLTLENPVVSVNGEAFVLPFALASGEFAELEDGAWIRYSDQGERLTRVAAAKAPRLRAGENDLAFAASTPDGQLPRAEVTVFALGEPVAAYGPLTDAMKREMSYEAMRPVTFAPSKGFDALPPVVTRPGETARLDVSLVGPIADPVLEVRTADGVKTLAFPTLAAGEVRRVKDGPAVSGSCAVTLKSSAARGADARLSLVKRYLVK